MVRSNESDLQAVEVSSKKWDTSRLFQRIDSPSVTPPPDVPGLLPGVGHPKGTRRSDDFPSLTFLLDLAGIPLGESLRMVPSWVKAFGAADNTNASEAAIEAEIYGILERSFQTWTDVAAFQWHRWYDWNFHVRPATQFDWTRGAGNRIEAKAEAGESLLTHDVIECEWDAGAFGPRPGIMFNDRDKGQTTVGSLWPMTGDWVWIAGRSIYDGGHEFLPKEPKQPKQPKGVPLCRSELHPCKAVAWAQREGFKFKGHAHHVPAVRFCFFASRLGGYVDFPTLEPSGKDYEFVVDLPLRPDDFQATLHDVGATSDFPFNRIALRPVESLQELNFAEFARARGKVISPVELETDFPPEVKIEPAPGGDPKKFQAKIKVPLKALVAKHPDVDSYGFVLSLGWQDPNGTQGRTLKRCLVNFNEMNPVRTKDSSPDEWRFKVCVNNRWFQWEREGLRPEGHKNHAAIDVALPEPLELFLEADESIRVHVHGAALNLLDDPFVEDHAPEGSPAAIAEGAKHRTTMFNAAQVTAEALRTGQNPATALAQAGVADATIALGVPLAAFEFLENLPIVGDVLTLVGLIPAIFGISPNQLIGLLGAEPAVWKRHMDLQPPRKNGAFVIQRVVARNTVQLLAKTLKDGNKPLGICDPGLGFSDEIPKNPFPLDKDVKDEPVTLLGVALREDDLLAELFEPNRTGGSALFKKGGTSRDKIDYEFSYKVTIAPQDVD